MGALLAEPAGRASGWAAGVRAPTAADGGISTSHALLGAAGGVTMQLSGLQVAESSWTQHFLLCSFVCPKVVCLVVDSTTSY